MREISCSSKVNAINNIVILDGPFDSSPKHKFLEFVLMAQFENTRLESDDLLCRQGLSNTICEF